MLKKISFSINNYFSAFSYINKNNLKKFYLIPGIINFFLVSLFYLLIQTLSSHILKYVEGFIHISSDSFIYIFIKLLIYLALFGVYYLFYKTLILIILSPFLSYLSEKVETQITGKEFNFTLKDNLHFIKRGIIVTLKSFLRELIFTSIILLLFFLPIINISVPILLFIVQSYYIGFSFIDYTLERHDYHIGTNIIRKNPIFFLINGTLFTLILFIPIIGIFIAPLVTVVATTTGTLKLISEEKEITEEESL